MEIRETWRLGLDLGIGSCGWAIVEETGAVSGRIVALGVRMFDVPETGKERTPTSQLRRQHRGMRRVLRRRRQRMNELRQLFREHGLIPDESRDALKSPGLDPWVLRAAALERQLAGPELAIALGHIARHRGFKSNSKRDRGANAPKDSSDMLKAIEATRERLKSYRSVGEMFAKDPEYALRKRNRDGDYTRSILRDDQEREARLIFDSQRRKGNAAATEELERRFIELAFFQRPLADSEDKVGDCPFELGEKRAARRSYSFELFRYLSRLAALRIRSGRIDRPLTAEELTAASDDFGALRGMTFKRLRKLLDLNDGDRFNGVPFEEEGKRDVTARAGDTAPGTYALRNVLGPSFQTLLSAPEKLDRIAFVLSFREDTASIKLGLESIGLEPLILSALMKGVEDGEFAAFSRAGHLSAKACRNIIPHLKRGLVYSDACKAAGYDHARREETNLDAINKPVARKALTECLKQVRAIVREYGLPGRIHVELARDVGRSKAERDEISRGIERRNKEKDKHRAEFKEVVGVDPAGSEDLMRFELWKEQNGRCLYTDQPIHPNAIVATDNSVQVDHILPWSRSGDDSFVNKTLCLASANQKKRGMTPFEWIGRDEKRWDAYVARVESLKTMKGRKKRNYLLKDTAVLEEKFRPRNLGDTRYATRLLADALKRLYPDDGTRRVFARPGPLTDRLRRGWGIQSLKKDAEGNRVDDDRHHALDALIVAATSESALQRLTAAFRESEQSGGHRDFARLDPPWPGFVAEAREKLAQVFVSRAERRRARGEAHAATIRQIAERDGQQIVYERKSVDALTDKDLERIKDPERNAKLIASLREWIAEGKPKDRRPLSPKGDPIAKVRLRTNKKPDVPIRDGAADRGEMVRVDVFRDTGALHFVPVYPHHLASKAAPDIAIISGREQRISPTAIFVLSIYQRSYLRIFEIDGSITEGYFRNFDRDSSRVTVTPHFTSEMVFRERVSASRIVTIEKIALERTGPVMRDGRCITITKETRTWRGAACT
jgi:CRISPR-associated endonuclease Csn1